MKYNVLARNEVFRLELLDFMYIYCWRKGNYIHGFNYGPCVLDNSYEIRYVKNNVLHREDGPAIITPSGYQAYCINGHYHRDDGPALYWNESTWKYYKHGSLHRLDGPAISTSNGLEYFIDGKKYSESAFYKTIGKK